MGWIGGLLLLLLLLLEGNLSIATDGRKSFFGSWALDRARSRLPIVADPPTSAEVPANLVATRPVHDRINVNKNESMILHPTIWIAIRLLYICFPPSLHGETTHRFFFLFFVTGFFIYWFNSLYSFVYVCESTVQDWSTNRYLFFPPSSALALGKRVARADAVADPSALTWPVWKKRKNSRSIISFFFWNWFHWKRKRNFDRFDSRN